MWSVCLWAFWNDRVCWGLAYFSMGLRASRGVRVENAKFSGFVSIWTKTYIETFKSALVYHYVARHLIRQHVNTMLISNNCPSFHLWWKENLVKHRKVSKYYETDCLQNFILLSVLLLTTKFVKNSHIWARIFFIFLKNVLKQTWNSFNTKF